MKFPFIVITALLIASLTAHPQQSLEENFRNPPNDTRLVQYGLYHHALEKYPRYGIGGFMAFFNKNFYQSNPNGGKKVGLLVNAASEKNMRVWLGDDDGYPSGMAGGRIVEENPAYEVRGLAMLTRDGIGAEPVTIKLPAGAERFVHAVLYPLVNGLPDLAHGKIVSPESEYIESTGLNGPWRLCAFASVIRNKDTQAQSTMQQFGHSGRYPDLMNREAMGRFLALMHEAITARIEDLPSKVECFYTNEPNLMQLHWEYGTVAPLACLPWDSQLPEKFKQIHGYDLMPQLDALYEGDTAEAKRVRIHFQQAVAKLLSVNFARQIREWCNARGIHSSGHFLLTEYLSMHVANYGDYLKVVSEFDLPAMEIGIPNPDQFGSFRDDAARFLSASAVWKKRDTTMCLLDPIIQGGGLQRLSPDTPLIRHAANMALLEGVNTFSSYMPLDAKPDGSATGYQVEDYRALNEYLGRACVLLRGAHPATSVALYYPIAMFQADYRPSNLYWQKVVPLYKKRQAAWDHTERALLEADIPFTIVHPDAVVESAVSNGTMQIGFGDYRYLVMPQMEFLPLAVLEKIKEFEAGGGTVLWVDTKPQYGEYDWQDAQLAAALKDEKVVPYADLAACITKPYPTNFNLQFDPKSDRVAVARFYRGDQPIYLLVNRTNEIINVSVQSPTAARVKVFTPSSGAIEETPLPASPAIEGFGSLLILP